MKHKNIVPFTRILLVCMLLFVLMFTGILFFLDIRWFFVVLPLAVITSIYTVYKLVYISRDTRRLFRRIGEQLSVSENEAIYSFPLPVIVCDESRRILWYNDLFSNIMTEEAFGTSFDRMSTAALEDFCSSLGKEIYYDNQYYMVHGVRSVQCESSLYTLYFFNITEMRLLSQEYKLSRPSVLLIAADNYEEVLHDARESQKSELVGMVDRIMEDFISQTNGVINKLTADKFVAIIEERHLEKIIENRFDILDKVRAAGKEANFPITLSIGVGQGASSLRESEDFARQALDMALGRGGDQVAVKTTSGYNFYGGVSKGVEKHTKVKTRIVATALTELIHTSSNVVLMGHRFGDLDCIGAAVGMAQTIRNMGKHAVIAVNYEKNLAKTLIDRMRDTWNADYFVSPEEAMGAINENTLLIILDTHNPDFVESPDVYKACRTVVVIDHHRKMVNYIDNAVIFYHEPYSSSASDMVAELMPYLCDVKPGRPESEALMAGIMLDTRNFTLRAGVRTFEAAAYLRKNGADTISVKQLFATSIDAYQRKAQIVASATVQHRCAIASCDFISDDIKIVTSQAADELLGLQDVDASFVLCPLGSQINISARSYGAVNVQVIMEMLNGGGHQTMAATQLKDTDLEGAKTQLLSAIREYYKNIGRK